MRPGSLFAFIVMVIVAIAHCVRVIAGIEVQINAAEVPMWISYVGVVLPAYIAWMLWRERDTA